MTDHRKTFTYRGVTIFPESGDARYFGCSHGEYLTRWWKVCYPAGWILAGTKNDSRRCVDRAIAKRENNMDSSGIDGTCIHEERWYRTLLSDREHKFHRVHDVGGEMQNLIIYTRCGIAIPVNDCEEELVDWSLKPPGYKQCKTCARCPSKIYPNNDDKLSTPKIIWGAAINLSGLWGPYKMRYSEESEIYYDRSGNFSIDCVGLNPKDGIIEFGSESENETKLWVSGAKAAMTMMKQWCAV